jgi:hypothetical protein
VRPDNRSDGGVPIKVGAIPGRAPSEETWAGANQAKDEKLRLRSVRRRAGAEGLEIRHSDYGYALVGTDRKFVDGRNDMSLKEIESWLTTAEGADVT